MQDLPFDINNVDADEVQALEATYRLLKEMFKVSVSEDSTFNVRDFDVFTHVDPDNIGGTLLINHPESGCYLIFLKVNDLDAVKSRFKFQVWASATLRNNFGRLTVTHEKMPDKIANPGNPAEVYFKDDPAFNKKFNVIAANKSQAQRSMTKAFRNVIMETGKTNWEMEIVNSSMVIGGVCPLDPKQTVYLAEIAGKFSRVK
ncbi:hypothetical protein [Mucilaginibacter sp. BT774]|uniref:hypothetical protein n=1 Tax=Mucilaginibacter sp. BT774 TaxID=3062276 RepID=UPI0026755B4C|nr:hypothetical protein [Mucilaginibacter sp. BT774]